MSIYGLPRAPVVVHLKMSANGGEKGEIFYRRQDTGFTQRNSAAFAITDDGEPHEYEVELPVDQEIDRIRLDPATNRGEATIYSLEVRDPAGIQKFDGRGLYDARGRVNQARVEVRAGQELHLLSVGKDPYFEFALARPANGPGPGRIALQRLIVAVAASLAFMGIIAGIARMWNARPWAGSRPISGGGLVGDELLEFTPAICAAFALIVASAVLFVGLKLNQSSIEVWEDVYPRAPVEQAIDVGSPRLIRSDEWKVHTPWILNQVLAGSPRVNHNLGGATAPLIASVPIADPVGWPNLKYAGFRILDIERGYSWLWAYKSFGLAFSFLWLLLILTRGDLAASLVGMLWVYFSSYTQWWFSSALPEIMTAFALGTTGALYALYSSRRSMMCIGAALVIYAASSLALNLYPPFVISLGYLAVFVVAGYGLEAGSLEKLAQDKGFRATVLIAAFVLVAAYGYWFLRAGSGAIDAMLDTVYPGRRVSSSGGVPLSKLMDGFFEAFRLGEDGFPRLPLSYNASEASGHLLLFPLVFLLVAPRRWLQRGNAVPALIACFCMLAFAWIAVELPGPINRAMQLAGWYAVTPKRAIMALGVGCILLCTVLLARMRAEPPAHNAGRASWISVPLIALVVAYLGWQLRKADASFFSWQVIALGTLVSGLIAIGIARGKVAFAAAGVAILALPAIGVNPLTSGLSSIMAKPVLEAARRQGGGPGDRWIAIGDNFFAQGLKAVGLNVVGGTQYIPDRSVLDVLDPQHRHAQVWNRYSTISIASQPGAQAARFELIHPDQYRIAIDVCSRAVGKLGITHVAYTVAAPAADLRCLEPLDAPEDSGVRLFRLKATNTSR